MSDYIFNPLTSEFRANPYPIYQQMRDSGKVLRFDERVPFIVGHWDVCEGLMKDPRFGRGKMDDMTPEEREAYMNLWTENIRPLVEIQADWMLFRDPPNHTRLRGLVNKAFTPRIINNLDHHIRDVADNLLDSIQAQGTMDIMADYAMPLPVVVIATMLGIPPEDRHIFVQWSQDMFVINDLVNLTMANFERAGKAAIMMSDYFEHLIAKKRATPADDLLSNLIAVEEVGDKLSHNELIATSILLLTAGYETTLNLLGNGMLALLQHPEQLALLKAQPNLMRSAVEELLRYDGPVHITSRTAREDVTLHGTEIKRGQIVALILASANRDPARFNNPDTLDITRDEGSPLSFGHGIHYCLGAPLARMETAIAFETLFRRLPNIALIDETPDWSSKVAFHGLNTLHVKF